MGPMGLRLRLWLWLGLGSTAATYGALSVSIYNSDSAQLRLCLWLCGFGFRAASECAFRRRFLAFVFCCCCLTWSSALLIVAMCWAGSLEWSWYMRLCVPAALGPSSARPAKVAIFHACNKTNRNNKTTSSEMKRNKRRNVQTQDKLLWDTFALFMPCL